MRKILMLALLSMFVAAPALAQSTVYRAPDTAAGESTTLGTTMERNDGTIRTDTNRLNDPNRLNEPGRTNPIRTSEPNRPADPLKAAPNSLNNSNPNVNR